MNETLIDLMNTRMKLTRKTTDSFKVEKQNDNKEQVESKVKNKSENQDKVESKYVPPIRFKGREYINV